MKKITLYLLLLLTTPLFSQTPQYTFTNGTGINSIPWGGGTWADQRSQFLWLPGDFGTSVPSNMAISKIYFRAGGVKALTTYTNFQIAIGQNSTTSLTTTWQTGLTTVINEPTYSVGPVVAGQWIELDLSANPFPFDPSIPLIVETYQTATSGAGITLLSGGKPVDPIYVTSNTQSYGPSSGVTAGSSRSYSYNFGFDLVSLLPDNAGVLSVDSPLAFCAGAQNVYATIKNYGTNQIDSVEVHWELNGVPQPTYFHNQILDTLNGTLPNTAQILLGSGTFSVGSNSLKVYTSMPNGVADTLNNNDTLLVNLQTATPPTNAFASNITLNSADITVSGGAGTIDYEFGPSGFILGTGTFGNTTNNPFNLSGLIPSTSYEIYVRTNCGSGDISAWAGPFSFCTAYATPFSESFDASTTPNCWDETGPTAWNYSTTAGFGAAAAGDHTANNGNYAWMDGSLNTSGEKSSLTTPSIDVGSLTVPMLSYWIYSNNIDDPALNKLNVDLFDGSTWHSIDSVEQNLGAMWFERYVDLSAYTITGAIQVRFSVTGSSVGIPQYHDILLDDISVIEAPTCFKPVNLSATNITLNSALLGWTEPNTATSWQIEYGPLGFGLGNGTIITATTNPYSLTGLNPSTNYQFYVRSACGRNDTSFWAGPFMFTTLNGIPFFEDFETFPISTAAVNFNGWTNLNTTTPRWQTGSSTSSASTGPTIDHTIGAGGIFTYLETSGGALGSFNDLISPSIYVDPSYNTIEFEFWYHKYGATMGDLEVYIDTNNVSNLITTIPGQTHFAGNDPWMSYSTLLTGYEGHDIRLRFRGIRGSSFTGDMAIDDISLDPIAPIDASITDLIDPLRSQAKCYTSTENVTVELSNLGQNPLDFTTDSAVITVDVTGAVTQTLGFTVNDNSINSGSPLATTSAIQVPMGTLDMSTPGTYYFTSTVNVNNDGVALNNTHLDTIMVMVPTGGTISGTELICMGDSVELASDGYFGSLQWQSSTGGAFTDIAGATSDKIVALPNVPTSYRTIACGTNSSDTLTITPVSAPTTMGDTAIVGCGSFGTAIMGASSPVPNLIFDWYEVAVGGTSIHSGDTMHYGVQTGATPNMSADTFYVSTKLGGGGADTMTVVPFLGGNSCGGGNMFNIIPSTNLTVEGFSINSLTNGPETVEVYRKNGTYDGSQLIPTNWTLVEMVNITANGTTNPSYVPLTNTFSINAGDTMGIYVFFNASYTNVTTGTVYSNPDMQVIIGDGLCGNFTGVNTGRAFNGQVMYTSGCETPRTMVIGAVDCIVGMDEQSNIGNVAIHPNPSNGIFILNGNNVEEQIEVSIYDTNGKKVYQLESKLSNDFRKQIDLSDLAKGIYFVKLQTENSFEMKKIVVQ